MGSFIREQRYKTGMVMETREEGYMLVIWSHRHPLKEIVFAFDEITEFNPGDFVRFKLTAPVEQIQTGASIHGVNTPQNVTVSHRELGPILIRVQVGIPPLESNYFDDDLADILDYEFCFYCYNPGFGAITSQLPPEHLGAAYGKFYIAVIERFPPNMDWLIPKTKTMFRCATVEMVEIQDSGEIQRLSALMPWNWNNQCRVRQATTPNDHQNPGRPSPRVPLPFNNDLGIGIPNDIIFAHQPTPSPLHHSHNPRKEEVPEGNLLDLNILNPIGPVQNAIATLQQEQPKQQFNLMDADLPTFLEVLNPPPPHSQPQQKPSSSSTRANASANAVNNIPGLGQFYNASEVGPTTSASRTNHLTNNKKQQDKDHRSAGRPGLTRVNDFGDDSDEELAYRNRPLAGQQSSNSASRWDPSTWARVNVAVPSHHQHQKQLVRPAAAAIESKKEFGVSANEMAKIVRAKQPIGTSSTTMGPKMGEISQQAKMLDIAKTVSVVKKTLSSLKSMDKAKEALELEQKLVILCYSQQAKLL